MNFQIVPTTSGQERRPLSYPIDTMFIRSVDHLIIRDPYILGCTYDEIMDTWKALRGTGASIDLCDGLIDTRLPTGGDDLLQKVLENQNITSLAYLCAHLAKIYAEKQR